MDEKIREFMALASDATPAQAAHYLEVSRGDVNQALNQFFENRLDPLDDDVQARPPSPPKQKSSSGLPDAWAKNASSKTRSTGSGRFASLSDLQSDDHDDSSEEEGQEFFAGGKASGVALQGPPSAKKPTQETIENILKTAQEGGRKEQETQTAQPKKKKIFHGQGQRLGDSEEPTPAPAPAPEVERQREPEPMEEAEELNYTLTFWENGFSIDDGPLRDYKDPVNEEFLRTLGQGMVPQELKAKPNQPVRVGVQHRVTEKYVPPKKVLKPFAGAGHRLGSEVPGDSPSSSSSSASASSSIPTSSSSSSSASSSSSSSSLATPPLLANPNEPLVSLQIRLADGTRLVAKFNPSQTVQDIRRFINMTKPGEAQREYILLTTFPNKELTDPTATLQASNLLNAVVVQRYK